MYSSLVIKVGTNVITDEKGHVNTKRVAHLVEQIEDLKERGISVILVTSGAMGCGSAILGRKGIPEKMADRQVLAAVGQVKLVETYAEFFSERNHLCAQVLLTKRNFRTRDQFQNIRNCFTELLEQNITPIVNENDVVSVRELTFTDNDELAGLIASMMNSDALILLTSVDGVYDGNPKDSSSKIIDVIEPGDKSFQDYIRKDMTKFGRGGMRAKCSLASKLSSMGIPVHIVNGATDKVLTEILDGKQTGTLFKSADRTSGTKRWVGTCDGQEKGTVYVNMGAAEALLKKEKAASLLPVGVTCVLGDFRKGDIIRICDEDSVDLGMGMAQYDADTARSLIGKKGEKPLVHYDYLYLN